MMGPLARGGVSQSKLEFLEASKSFWNPDKTQFWQDAGVDLVIDRREGYCLYDLDGDRLIDVHLNGGTYNLGHRNPELVEVLNAGAQRFDMGNHHFPALARTALAEALAACTPEGLQYTIYGAGGAEAVELAIKSARNATGKRKIVSIIKAYHGHSGLSVKTGDERFSKTFLSEDTLGEFVQVPFNDLDAMEDALKGSDVAAVIMETIPATYGFPMPREGYLPAVKELCVRHDALYIADEVQTGLMRTGEMWAITKYGVTPDIMVIGKGITGGMYPISCCVVSERAGQWLKQDGFAHMSTTGGAELGCVVALKVLEITQRPEVRSMVRHISDYIRSGLDGDPGRLPGLLRRNPPERGGDGARVRPPRGCEAGHAPAVRERRLGHLLDPRPPGAPVQARDPHAAEPLGRPPATGRDGHRSRARGREGLGVAASRRQRRRRSEGVMDPQIRQLINIDHTTVAMRARAEMILDRARWASQIFQRYDRETTLRIADSAARAAHEKAGEYAEWAVRETGFGVAAHKRVKNEMSSIALVDHYRDWNFVDPDRDERAGVVRIPRPAGVIFALVPSTNPIATVYFKVLCALMTRNAVVISPHPAARACCVDAAKTLAEAALEAGAPDGAVQVLEEVSLPLVEEFMKSDRTDVILATGGVPMVRAAYSSSNPAIGVGPGNAPVYVDASADLKSAAAHIVDSKAFDNSVLCTNESVLITVEDVAADLRRELSRAGAHLCGEAETEALRRYLFHDRGFNVEALGRDAAWIAQQAGFRASPRTRVLVTPIRLIGPGEDLSREKLCPVLGLFVARGHGQALLEARALLRYAGAGHSAADSFHGHAVDHGVLGRRGGVPGGGQRPVQPGCGRVRDRSRTDLHGRDRVLRPVLDRRECRPPASRQLDPGRMARRRPRRRGGSGHREAEAPRTVAEGPLRRGARRGPGRRARPGVGRALRPRRAPRADPRDHHRRAARSPEAPGSLRRRHLYG